MIGTCSSGPSLRSEVGTRTLSSSRGLRGSRPEKGEGHAAAQGPAAERAADRVRARLKQLGACGRAGCEGRQEARADPCCTQGTEKGQLIGLGVLVRADGVVAHQTMSGVGCWDGSAPPCRSCGAGGEEGPGAAEGKSAAGQGAPRGTRAGPRDGAPARRTRTRTARSRRPCIWLRGATRRRVPERVSRAAARHVLLFWARQATSTTSPSRRSPCTCPYAVSHPQRSASTATSIAACSKFLGMTTRGSESDATLKHVPHQRAAPRRAAGVG